MTPLPFYQSRRKIQLSIDGKWTLFIRLWGSLGNYLDDKRREETGVHHSWCSCGIPPCSNA